MFSPRFALHPHSHFIICLCYLGWFCLDLDNMRITWSYGASFMSLFTDELQYQSTDEEEDSLIISSP